MCLPLIALAVSTAVSGVSAGIQASAAAKQADYQSRVYDYNANVAESRAAEAHSASVARASEARTEAGRQTGRSRALFAARGLDPGTGTAGSLIDESRLISKLESERIVAGGRQQASQFAIDAFNYRAQAESTRASVGPTVASYALQGVGSVASSWYKIGAEEGWLGAGG